jgi:hypothetical protein
VPRRKGYSNPVTVFTNIDEITRHLARHIATQGAKTEANQCDPDAWVYDIGENGDCSVETARVTDIRTSPIAERIAAINDFVDAGYEVHVNFSPVILTPTWRADWEDLFAQLDAALHPRAKAQLAAEVIFLTHNEGLHEVNLGWHPKAEKLLWTPAVQETKRSQNGAENVRYRHPLKAQSVAALGDLMARTIPYCRIRYAF